MREEIHKFRNFISMVLLGVIMSGCVTDDRPGTKLVLNATDPDKAVILAGIVIEAEGPGAPAISIHIVPVNTNDPTKMVKIHQPVLVRYLKNKTRNYVAVDVHPGRYYIGFTEFEEYSGPRPYGLVCYEGSYIFNIKPGEVNYIGDLTLKFRQYTGPFKPKVNGDDYRIASPESLKGIVLSYDDDGARQAMTTYKTIEAPLVRAEATAARVYLHTEKTELGRSDACELRP